MSRPSTVPSHVWSHSWKLYSPGSIRPLRPLKFRVPHSSRGQRRQNWPLSEMWSLVCSCKNSTRPWKIWSCMATLAQNDQKEQAGKSHQCDWRSRNSTRNQMSQLSCDIIHATYAIWIICVYNVYSVYNIYIYISSGQNHIFVKFNAVRNLGSSPIGCEDFSTPGDITSGVSV